MKKYDDALLIFAIGIFVLGVFIGVTVASLWY